MTLPPTPGVSTTWMSQEDSTKWYMVSKWVISPQLIPHLWLGEITNPLILVNQIYILTSRPIDIQPPNHQRCNVSNSSTSIFRSRWRIRINSRARLADSRCRCSLLRAASHRCLETTWGFNGPVGTVIGSFFLIPLDGFVRINGLNGLVKTYTGMSCWYLVNGCPNPYISRLDTSRK